MSRPLGVKDYPTDFRREAVALARRTTFSHAAEALGCARRSLFVWARALEVQP
jgi:transposase-like protein